MFSKREKTEICEMTQKITIIRHRRVPSSNVNAELQFIGNSLGLFSLRDKNSSCFRIFIVLLRRSKKNQSLSSDDIAEQLQLSRGTVVHHLNMLMNSGIVLREGGAYILREPNLEKLIREIKHDIENTLGQLMEVAKDVDEKLG